MTKHFITPLLILILLFSSSCKEEFNGYQIDGQIKNLPEQQLILEFLSKIPVQLDTVMTDAEGKFSMKGNTEEKGFYRLINGDKFWIILLEDTKVSFVADANDETFSDIEITNYPAGIQFQKTVQFLIDKKEILDKESMKIRMQMADTSLNAADKAQIESAFGQLQTDVVASFNTEVESLLPEYPFSAFYLLTQIDPNNNFDFFKKQIAELDKLIPTSSYFINLKKDFSQFEAQQKPAQNVNASKISVPFDIATQGEGASGDLKNTEIIMKNQIGEIIKLSDLRGKIVLVDFWASWCRPCRAANPEVVKMYHKYKDQGFDIFSVSLDKNAEKWLEAIAKDGLIWESHVCDLKFWQNAGSQAWGVSSIPATYLLDKDGKILAKNLRGTALETKLAEIFK